MNLHGLYRCKSVKLAAKLSSPIFHPSSFNSNSTLMKSQWDICFAYLFHSSQMARRWHHPLSPYHYEYSNDHMRPEKLFHSVYRTQINVFNGHHVLSSSGDALLRLAFATASRSINLARYHNSQAHYAKGSPSHIIIVLRMIVSHRFQVLFHSAHRGPFHLSLTVLVRYRSSSSI